MMAHIRSLVIKVNTAFIHFSAHTSHKQHTRTVSHAAFKRSKNIYSVRAMLNDMEDGNKLF